MMFSISFPWLEVCHNSVSALLGFVHFFGGVSFPEWQDCSLSLAVGNIVLGFLLNSSSYRNGISLFFGGGVLYIHNAVYRHFFFCWAFFKRALSVLIVLSTTPFVWWWYGELVFSIMFESWNSLLNLSLVYCEQQSNMIVVDNPYLVGT